jgi:hypothetical protein
MSQALSNYHFNRHGVWAIYKFEIAGRCAPWCKAS